MIDHNPKHGAEITVSSDRTKAWINIDGICVCRIILSNSNMLELNIPPFKPKIEK
jgi:hypothetical protein